MIRTVACMKLLAVCLLFSGCHNRRLHVTAVPLSPWNQSEPDGIPYYLPKPLLVVAKNVRHIDETKVGLTNPAPIPNAFDDQASYADIKANVTVPGNTAEAAVNAGSTSLPTAFDAKPGLPDIWEKMTPGADQRFDDGVAPDSFYTYQIVFIPDLTQKYGLRIRGGPGEVRAAMNLVNGWMYTGMGPYYLKDSSTAQNLMAGGVAAMYAGRGVADVLNQVGEISKVAGDGRSERAIAADEMVDNYAKLARLLQSQSVVPQTMCNYAQVFIYEPELQADGRTTWRLIAEHCFDRHYFQPQLDPDAVKIFQQILQEDEKERLHQRQIEQQKLNIRSNEVQAERARAERGAGTSLPNGTPGASLPGINPTTRGQTVTESGEVTPPPNLSGTIDEQSLRDYERKILGLPLGQSLPSTVPATEVNVNFGPDTVRDRPKPHHKLFFWKKDTPKQEVRVQRALESSVTSPTVPGGGSPGASINNF